MHKHQKLTTIAIAATCSLAAGAAGIAGASAATTTGKRAHAADASGALPGPPGPGGVQMRFGSPGGGPGGPIHSVAVVPNSSGGFDTVTTDDGTLKSVSGTSITLTEGTKSTTYATPSIDVGSSAKVIRDGATSSLTSLVTGDHVTIVQAASGNIVLANDSSFRPAMGGQRGGQWGPPPGAPGGVTGATGPQG